MRKKIGVSLENGYTRIANELLELVCKAPMTDMSRRFLLAIMRLTYGWQASEKPLSRGCIMRIMGIKSCKTFTKTRDKLHNENVVIHRFCGQRTKSVYKVNTEGVKNLVSFYIRQGVKGLSPFVCKRGHSKDILKKEKKQQKVSQPLGDLGGKQPINIINNITLPSIINTNPNKQPGRLVNDKEAWKGL